MSQKFMIPVLASILILGTLGLTDVFAGNQGNNGCEKANPNAKACENNPNATPNTPPSIGSVSIFQEGFDITGQTISGISTLTCVANDANDTDEDLVSFTFSWFLNGNLVDTGDTHSIFPGDNASNDVFSGELICEITPFDGTDFGAPVTATVTILGCPPNCGGTAI